MAVIRSTSKPAALPVLVSMYSCGGYVVSVPTVNVPGVIRSVGAVTVGVDLLGVGTVVVPVVVVEPQATRTSTNNMHAPKNSSGLGAHRAFPVGENNRMKQTSCCETK